MALGMSSREETMGLHIPSGMEMLWTQQEDVAREKAALLGLLPLQRHDKVVKNGRTSPQLLDGLF